MVKGKGREEKRISRRRSGEGGGGFDIALKLEIW